MQKKHDMYVQKSQKQFQVKETRLEYISWFDLY